MKDDEITIARLEEEKAVLWEIIHGLEEWMYGEGCFISPRIKVQLDIARTLMAPVKEDTQRYRRRLFDCFQAPQLPKIEEKPRRKRGRPAGPPKEKKKSEGWTPEKRAAHAESARQRMLTHWAKRKQGSTA
jgi:hypothetical protein